MFLTVQKAVARHGPARRRVRAAMTVAERQRMIGAVAMLAEFVASRRRDLEQSAELDGEAELRTAIDRAERARSALSEMLRLRPPREPKGAA